MAKNVGAPRGHKRQGTTCVCCNYWSPSEVMPRVGRCDNPTSSYFGRPAFSNKPTEDCFVTKSLEGLEFMWCQSHRQTIYFAELPDHASCSVFACAASFPVEDEAEMTLAGD